ncbi:MAG: glycosyl-4,4'-diaponeurosporenoate acyltransferase [Ruminococcaceae bacterium]|nr:glycosyl-4,4'-diaponeurosporenoate acyltransferase [Oscillospiraceae bacterium]
MKFANCAIYLAVIGTLSFYLGRIVPKKWFHSNSFLFRCRKWEKNGQWYLRLHIRKWHRCLPDMSKIFSRLMPAKAIDQSVDEKKLQLMIQETCVAEATHAALMVAGCACLVIWPGIGGFVITLINAIGNLPFVLIQRFNRPRLERLLKKYTQEVVG